MNIDKMKTRKYLHNSDFDEVGTSFIVNHVSAEREEVGQNGDMEYVMYFEGEKKGLVFKPENQGLAATAMGSKESDDWPGQSVTLFTTTTKYGGKIVPCVRIKVIGVNAPYEKPDSNEGTDDIPF